MPHRSTFSVRDAVARHDPEAADRLGGPERLYGREAELEQLIEAFRRVASGGVPELVLLSGGSGVGKSSVARELSLRVRAERGSFATGKADPYDRDAPYAAIASALRELTIETLGASDDAANEVRVAVLAALGPDAGVLLDLVRPLALVLPPGDVPASPPLPADQAKARLFSACRRFIAVLARRERPLALFLDDLQWVDRASLELFEHVVTHPETRHVLAVGAYREAEVGADHAASAMIDEVRAAGTPVRGIRLSPLSPAELTELVADVVRAPHDEGEVASLARAVHQKTRGNPLFAVQLLRALARDGLLRMDPTTLRWRWDATRIEDATYADDVVSLTTAMIATLPAETRSVLLLAAALGSVADVHVLARLTALRDVRTRETPEGSAEERVRRACGPAVEEGLLLPVQGRYRFLHDRVRQAAHALVPAAERARFELAIGRALLAMWDDSLQRAEHLFEIAHHLLLGAEGLVDRADRERIGLVFLEAGRKAKAGAAYGVALDFLDASARLLGVQVRDARGGRGADREAAGHEREGAGVSTDLAFGLRFDLAECTWLSGEPDEAERALPGLLRDARTTSDVLAVHGLAIRLHMLRGDGERAVDESLTALDVVGVHWTRHPESAEVNTAYEEVWRLLGARPIEALSELPPLVDGEVEATLGIVSLALDSAFAVDENLHSLLACYAVQTSLRHGNAASSFVGYAVFAHVCAKNDLFAEAGRFARLACASLDRPELRPYVAKICLIASGVVAPWTSPLRQNVERLERGMREGAAIGDVLFGCYCADNLAQLLFAAGETLEHVHRRCGECLAYIQRVGYGEIACNVRHLHFLIERLRGQARPRDEQEAPRLAERAARSTPRESGASPRRAGPPTTRLEDGTRRPGIPRRSGIFSSFLRCLWRLEEWFFFGEPERALQAADEARPWRAAMHGTPAAAEFDCYHALTLASLHDAGATPLSPDDPRLARLSTYEGRLRGWASSSRESFGPQHALLRAEIARLRGEPLEAEVAYEEAIVVARDVGLVQYEAVASEAAARFYRERGLGSIARMYLGQARAAYAHWGACGKVRHLEQRHPELLEATREPSTRMRDELLSIAAHELRAPLTPLKMQIEVLALLARRAIPDDTSSRRELLDMLDRSKTQLDRLTTLMTELLDISRIRTGHLVLDREDVDLAKLVREVVERHRPELDRAGCAVAMRCEGPLLGRWDRTRIEQVALNLLTNAIKYGAGKPVEIEVGAVADDGARLTIRDHGIGIERKDLERIFDRFERAVPVHDQGPHRLGGFGLGLYTAKEIVAAHGGEISVESEPGAGSTFTVLLPRTSGAVGP